MRVETAETYPDANDMIDAGNCDAVIVANYDEDDYTDYWCHVMAAEPVASAIEQQLNNERLERADGPYPSFYFNGTADEVTKELERVKLPAVATV